MNIISKWMAAAACGLALAACGGDGGGHGITITASAGVGGKISPETVKVDPGATQTFTITPDASYLIDSVGGTCGGTLEGTAYTTNPITAACTVVASFSRTFAYEWQADGASADADVMLAVFNQEGAKGYRYLYRAPRVPCIPGFGGLVCPGGPEGALLGGLFVNDGLAPSYTYELLPNPGNAADFIAQANTQGAKGYQYVAWHETIDSGLHDILVSHVLYRKDGGSAATYTYAAEAAGPMAVDAFVAQANARGQSGYYFYGRIGHGYPEPANLYVKNNASKATYTYETLSNLGYVLREANLMGERGYFPMYLLTDILGSGYDFPMLHIKDQTQSATFVFQAPTRERNLISLLNSYGAQGYSPWNNDLFVTTYFFKASNCSGSWLCGVPNLP